MHVTTLPCKISAVDMFDFQQVTDGVHRHVQVAENKSDIRRCSHTAMHILMT